MQNLEPATAKLHQGCENMQIENLSNPALNKSSNVAIKDIVFHGFSSHTNTTIIFIFPSFFD
jgi:hypothetical protein